MTRITQAWMTGRGIGLLGIIMTALLIYATKKAGDLTERDEKTKMTEEIGELTTNLWIIISLIYNIVLIAGYNIRFLGAAAISFFLLTLILVRSLREFRNPCVMIWSPYDLLAFAGMMGSIAINILMSIVA